MSLLPWSRPLTREDIDTLPDDGHRYELIDGAVIVTPVPDVAHQVALGHLMVLLHDACPRDHEVLPGPFNVTLGPHTSLQPDLVAARRDDFTDDDLPVAPLLVVEVLTEHTRRVDLTLKRACYEAAGTASYWVVDPDQLTLTAWELIDGSYAEVAHVTGDEAWTASRPFPVTVVPAALRD